MPEKIRYEVDPHNRLIIRRTGKESELPRYRSIAEGEFKTKGKNALFYHVKRAYDSNIPQQIRFEGTWSLDENHNAVFTLNKWGDQIAGNKLIINGIIADASSNELIFAVTTKTGDNKSRIYTLRLTGSWQADTYNRLSFSIEKEKGPFDAITFEGIWEVNNHNQLVYSYARENPESGKRAFHTVTFRGWWDIKDKYRISYALDRRLKSSFSFKTSLGVPMRKTGRDVLKYEIGTVLGKIKTPIRRDIKIFGNWRMDEKRGFLFEIEEEQPHAYSIVLGADIWLDKKNNIQVKLRNKEHRALGLELVFSRKFAKNLGEAFVKTLASREKFTIHAGAGLVW